jgi:hypothetical protein
MFSATLSSVQWSDNLTYPTESCLNKIDDLTFSNGWGKGCVEVIKRIGIIILAALGIAFTFPLYLVGKAVKCLTQSASPTTDKAESTKTILEKSINGMTINHFFETPLFRDKIAAQCHTHAELEVMIGLCLVLLQLIKNPNDEQAVLQSIGQLTLKELKENPGIDWGNALEKDHCIFANSTAEKYYAFAVKKAWDTLSYLADDEQIKSHLTDCLYVSYHGTNTTSLAKIAAIGMHGLSANDLQSEIDTLQQAFKDSKTKLDRQFPYHTGQKKTVYYQTRNPLEAFNYAKASPEWFSVFMCYAQSGSELNKHFRYEHKDEEKAVSLFKQIVDSNAKEDGWTKEQTEKMGEFFETNWRRFGQALPIVMAMPIDQEIIDTFYSQEKRLYLGLFEEGQTQTKEQFIQVLAHWMARNDHLTSDKTIPPNKLTSYQFPMIKLGRVIN